MKCSTKHLSAAVALAMAAASVAHAAPVGKPAGYAERIYSEYAAAAGDGISFDIETTLTGSMKELAGVPLAKVLGTPEYVITASSNGLNFSDLAYTKVHSEWGKAAGLNETVEAFNAMGYPAEDGTFRHFSVIVAVGKDARTHQSMEFCWASLSHCVVIDPSIEFLDSMVNERSKAMAEGWGPRVTQGPKLIGSHKSGQCTLAGTDRSTWRHWTWPAKTFTYHNGFGATNVTKNMGEQKYGLRCDTSCRIGAYGHSNVSSGFGNWGFDVKCDQARHSGKTGRNGTSMAESKCTHKFSGSAKAIVSIKGDDYGADLAWELTGGVDARGGQIWDNCGYY